MSYGSVCGNHCQQSLFVNAFGTYSGMNRRRKQVQVGDEEQGEQAESGEEFEIIQSR